MNNKSDYVNSIATFRQQFSTEETCEEYLIKSRWPNGFRCPVPSCRDTQFYRLRTRRALKCKKNGHQTFLTAGTAMQDTRIPLRLWFWAAYLLATSKTGISALQIQRQLGIKRYETAFNILHKLRASMVNPFIDSLGPVVEVDETYIGRPATGGKRVKGGKTARVVIIVERKESEDGKESIAGEIRLRHITDESDESVIRFMEDTLDEDSTIITDPKKSYGDLAGYTHKREAPLSLAPSILADLKTWIEQQFHGVSKKHLQAYLNEYVFVKNRDTYSPENLAKVKVGARIKLNRRKKEMEEDLKFEAILGLSSKVRFPTYKKLYSGEWKHPKGIAV